MTPINQAINYPIKQSLFSTIAKIIIFAMISVFVSGCGLAGEPEIVATAAPTTIPAELVALFSQPGDLALGEQVFAQNCTACHGERGLGDGASVLSGAIPSIVNFADPSTLNVIEPTDYYTVITEGRLERFMPPWGGVLSDAERWAVANYVYGFRGVVETADAESSAESDPLAADSAMEEASGTISGALLNGTASSERPDGLSVALQTMSLDFQEVDFQMTTVSGGGYTFTDVPMRADHMFVVTVVYQDRVFASPLISADPAVLNVDAPITLYETTDDPAVVEINLLVTRVEQQDSEIIVTQVVNFRNTSDRLFVRYNAAKERDEAGHIALPPEATVLNEDELMRCCVIEDGVLYDNEPLIPGADHMFRVVYSLPPTFPLSIPYAFDYRITNQLELMLTPGALAVASEQFVAQGAQQFSTGTYDIYLADAPAPGERVAVEITAVPIAVNMNIPLAPLLGLVGGGLMASAGVLYFRLYVSRAASQQRLLSKIADLDTVHQAHRMPEAQYQAERARLKARLAAILTQEQRTMKS